MIIVHGWAIDFATRKCVEVNSFNLIISLFNL